MDPKDLDHYYLKAKKLGYAARSIFKLEQLDEKGRFFKKGSRVIDLGSAPGSWIQYIRKKIGEKGRIIGIDYAKLTISPSSNLTFIQSDIYDVDLKELKKTYGAFDVVTSDMAPKTSGNALKDHLDSLDLCRISIELSKKLLNKNGVMICKVFEGEDLMKFFEAEVKPVFKTYKLQKPKASRRTSKEKFLVARL